MASSIETLIEQAQAAEREGRRDHARALYERALYGLRGPEQRVLASTLLCWAARTHRFDANSVAALDCIDAALAIAELAGDPTAIANAINGEAAVRLQEGELERAEALYLRVRETARAGDPVVGAQAALNLGIIANVRGDLEKTLRFYRMSLAEFRSLGAHKDLCFGLNNMGMLFTDLERWTEAENAYDEAVQIAIAMGDVATRIGLEGNRAELLIARGDIDQAQHACELAVELSQQSKDHKVQAEIHKHLGTIARHRGDLALAEEHLSEAQRISTERRDMLLSAKTAREQAELYRRLGRNRDALLYFNRSHRQFTQLAAKRDLADVNRRTSRLESHFLDVVRHWAGSIESKDRYTQGHCERVADISCALAVRAGLETSELFWFRIGAMIHDVGKLIIPGEVLNKPGKLSPDEWELVKRHPVTGVEMLAEIDFPGDVIPMVRSHHERWDGAGYPDRLSAADIPRSARILCIADVYDALTSRRSYKAALDHEKAMEIMRRDIGTQFDPALFPLFEELMRTRQSVIRPRVLSAEPRPLHRAPVHELAVAGPRDDLTGLLTRRPFAETANNVLRDRGAFASAALLVVDVDLFKRVNDAHGHLQGDAVLRAVATVLRGQVGDSGIVGRYAGDEFVVLLTQSSGADAREVGERLRDVLRRTEVAVRDQDGTVLRVTVSIGIAVATPEHGDFEGLFASADRALFEAKRRGRDSVFMSEHEADPVLEPSLNLKQFVGRDGEMRRLMRLLEASVETGVSVAAVIGEAGVGKSTLIRQLAPEVRLRAGSLVSGRCLEADAKPPYAPWAEVIAAIHHSGIVGPKAWKELPRVVSELGRSSAHRDGNKYTLFDEIAEYLRLAAASRPLVIILDDMQWADCASWDVLEHLLARLEQERILICLTMRSEDVRGEVLHRRNRLSRDERFHELLVPRLSESELQEWLSNVFGGRPIDAALASYVHRVSEGNPLLATQLLRVLIDDEGLRFSLGRWELRPDAEIRLPAAVTGLMDRRLERLTHETQRVLIAGAVIGRVFDIDLVAAAGVGTEEELLDAVDEGIAHSVIEPTADDVGSLFVFTHALLVDAIKRRANPRRLARLHGRVAQAMEARGSHSIAEMAVHFDRAGIHDKAYAYAMAAGSNAVGVYAHTEARGFFEIAVRTAESDTSRARALHELAGVEETEGHHARTEELCARALDLLTNHADATDALPLRRMRERMRALRGQPPVQTIAACRSLLDQAVRLGERAEEAALLGMISQCYSRLGQLHEARVVGERAAEAAEMTGRPKVFADALLRLGTTVLEGDEEDASPYYRRALDLFRAAGDRCGEARCSINLGIVCQRRGDPSDAEENYETALATARGAYAVDLIGLASLNLGVLYVRRGSFDLARERFDEALTCFGESSNEPNRVATLFNLAQLASQTGDWPAAASMYDEVALMAARIGLPDLELGARGGLGLAALSVGERLGAEDAMHWIRANIDARPEWWFQGRELVDTLRVRLTADRGDQAYAFRLLRDAVDVTARHDVYAAAQLIAECAAALPNCGGSLMQLLDEFVPRLDGRGFTALSARLSASREALAIASAA